ncbi:MAG: GTP-binding protein gtr1 [Caeruleum heppii]|nr:MAG: GTP-binding protein gtr1 [Caeruleum heppii]
MDSFEKKAKKKKVLLMGKSGSGKSSMRSIIFSNYVAKDTRRLGATIDVEHSHVKFLGNLTLNLWDCGGQDAFVENYLSNQRTQVFSHVEVLIYVFDIESREFERDLVTFSAIIRALRECSSDATVFCLIHKMDLVQDHFREKLFQERAASVNERGEKFNVTCFPTTIWDQSLYKAWANIIYTLIPDLSTIEGHLQNLADVIDAEEVVLFERTTFLVVTHVTTNKISTLNPSKDRFERLSNIVKTFKQTIAKHTGLPKSSPQFIEMSIQVPKFNMFIARFTANTYILVVIPPGLATYNTAVLNARLAVEHFEQMDALGRPSTTGATGSSGDTRAVAA